MAQQYLCTVMFRFLREDIECGGRFANRFFQSPLVFINALRRFIDDDSCYQSAHVVDMILHIIGCFQLHVPVIDYLIDVLSQVCQRIGNGAQKHQHEH